MDFLVSAEEVVACQASPVSPVAAFQVSQALEARQVVRAHFLASRVLEAHQVAPALFLDFLVLEARQAVPAVFPDSPDFRVEAASAI